MKDDWYVLKEVGGDRFWAANSVLGWGENARPYCGLDAVYMCAMLFMAGIDTEMVLALKISKEEPVCA